MYVRQCGGRSLSTIYEEKQSTMICFFLYSVSKWGKVKKIQLQSQIHYDVRFVFLEMIELLKKSNHNFTDGFLILRVI